jgi:hypothetical protein
MDVDGDDKVIEMKRSVISDILADDADPVTDLMPQGLREWALKGGAEPKREAQPSARRRPEAGQRENAGAGELPAGDAGTAIPRRGDPYDKAYGRPASRMLPTLCFVLADGNGRAFEYGGRLGGPDWLETPKGLVIVQRFRDAVPMETVLAGDNLDELYELLFYRKVPWVRALPPGKVIHNRTMPVITAIIIRPWEPA